MSILNFIKNLHVFFIILKFCSVSNLMPNFITKILSVEIFTNFKVVELEHEFEPGDLDGHRSQVALRAFPVVTKD